MPTFLQPLDGSDPTEVTFGSDIRKPVATAEDISTASQYNAGFNRTPGAAVGAVVAGSAVDLVDTVASSLPGVARGQVNELFLSRIGNPGLTRFMEENKGAIEVGSGVLGVIAADVLTRRMLRPASGAYRIMESLPFARNIAALDKQYESAIRVAKLTARESALQGAMGVERFATSELSLSRLGMAPLVTTPGRAAANVFRTQVGLGLRQNVGTELVMAATLHNNSFLYSDDFAHNLAWGVAGLGIGGIFDRAVAAHTLRKIANSDVIRRINAGVFDLTGKEGDRLTALNRAKDLQDMGLRTDSYIFAGAGVFTDRATSLAIQAGENSVQRGATARATRLFSKSEPLATQQMVQVYEEANKATVRGLQGVSRAGFVLDAKGSKPGAYRMVKEGMLRQPDYLWGIEEIGTAVDDMSITQTALTRNNLLDEDINRLSGHLERGGVEKTKIVIVNGKKTEQKWLAKFKPEQIESMQKLLSIVREAKIRPALVSFEPGEWAPARFAEAFEGFEHGKPIREVERGDDPLSIFTRETPTGKFGVSSNGDLFHGDRELSQLSTHDMLHMYSAGRDLIQHFATGGNGIFRVSEKPNWFQLDLATQIFKVTQDPARVQLPKGMSLESAAIESLAQKVDALKKYEKFTAAQQARNMSGDLDSVEAFKLKLQLNLPRLNGYQQAMMDAGQHPFDLLLAGFKSGDEVRATSYPDLLKAMNDSRMIAGFTDETAPRLEDLIGNSFNFLKSRDGEDLTPLIGYRRPMNPAEWSQDSLALRQTMKAEYVRDTLLGETSSPLIREIAQLVTADPNFIEAGKVAELGDDQIRSFVPGFGGAAPQTGRGNLMNAITSRERRDVDNLTNLAASRVRELVTRVTQGVMKRVIETNMGDVITRVNQPGNAGSKLLLNQFHTFRQGWELVTVPKTLEKTADGKEIYGFVLDHTSLANQKRYAQMFGAELKKGELLKNPEGKAIVVDKLAMETLNRMQAVHAESLAAKNTILRANGLPELKAVPWYAPPPNLKGKYVAYTFDAFDNVVPGMTVIANTPQELGVLSAQLQKSDQWEVGYRLRQRGQVSAFMDLWDKAQMDYIAPNVTAIQPRKHNYGITGGNLLNPNAFDEALVTMRDNLIGHGDDLMSTLFKEQIKSAEARARIAQLESAVGGETIKHSSVFSRYIENITGKNALAAQDSFFGKIQSGIVDSADRLLAEFPELKTPSDIFNSMKEYFRSASPVVSKANTERFTKLSQALGPYMPYKSAMQMVERETGFKTPREVAELTSALSWFEASSRLRWLESMHAVANFGGILANAPAVIRALQPLAGESIQDTAKRTGNLVMNLVDENGRNIPILNIPKLMWKGMKDTWMKSPDEFTLKAERLGYMNQEVAEFNRTWGAIDSAEGFKGFAKKADYYAGWMSDKSEGFSRQWGMYMGREVAQSMGITNVDDQLAFAHDLTNKMIANYDPRNRPEVFQGALGAPLGLFQSYVINYYQRMFRYIETDNTRLLAVQGAAQSAVFGMSSLPGWKQLNWAFFDQNQAENDDPVDSMYRRFGPDADWIMHGTLSNLPKLFGADGISLYTRGDSEVRMPSISAGPIADTVSRIATAFGAAAGALRANDGSVGTQQLSEIISNMVTNRPLSGLIEVVGASGFDTSNDGQVISKQTFDSMNSVYRLMGVKGMMQQKQTEAFYANKTAQEEQAARRDDLIASSRAAIRAGNTDSLPGLFKKYTQEGGAPEYFTRWVKDMVASSLNTRTEQQLLKALKKPDENMNYIMRLIDSQVGVRDGELNTEDYGHEDMIDRIVKQGWETNPEPDSTAEPQSLDGLPEN